MDKLKGAISKPKVIALIAVATLALGLVLFTLYIFVASAAAIRSPKM